MVKIFCHLQTLVHLITGNCYYSSPVRYPSSSPKAQWRIQTKLKPGGLTKKKKIETAPHPLSQVLDPSLEGVLSVAVYFEYLIFLFFLFLLACLLALRKLNLFSSYPFNSQPGVTFEKFKEKKMKAFDKDKNKKFNKKELEKILNSP